MKIMIRRMCHKIRRALEKPIVKWCLIILLTIFLAIGVFITIHVSKAPDMDEINVAPEGYVTTIYDKDNNLTKNLSVTESNRIYVPLNNIPKDLQEAFIAIEDQRFYHHHGIDLKGIIRAGWIGVTNGFKFSQGASTITQQLLKNNVFVGWMEEESLYDRISRKIQEQYLAVKIEKEYSKEQILENYLNTINLGSGTRGVQVAAQYYYGKDVAELTLAQSALIAGITKNPSAYNPVNHPEKSVERQQLVLKAMLDQGYISKEEYEDAAIENVISKLITDPTDNRLQTFSWFEESLLKQIVEDLTEEYTYNEDEAWDLIYSGGLKIYSTLDPQLQNICESVVESDSWYSAEEEVSVVMNDVLTGAVVAIVGGREEKISNLVYNRATDAIRQPGSTVKVIGEYAAAIDNQKLTLGSVVDDEPYCYSDGTNLNNSYRSYKGMMTIREAIANSSNVVALKVFQMMTAETVYEYLQKFGITSLTEKDLNEALAIGGTYHGVTNLELTGAYNTIANKGKYVEPFCYTKVVDMKGKTILERGVDYTQAINEETAILLTSAMESVITSGTGKSAAVEGLTLAGKSGTTNQNKDVWFVGFSSHYTCGVWGGNDDYSAQKNGNYVKLIWKQIMDEAHLEKDNKSIIDTTNLISVETCTKCGKIAVENLCNETIQGNMAKEEYYVSGTEPTEVCDCHEILVLCEASGMTPGKYCPNNAKLTTAYLKTATAGTEDMAYVLPKTTGSSCDVHTNLWDVFDSSETEKNEKDEEKETEQKNEDENEQDHGGNWFTDMFDSIFGGR